MFSYVRLTGLILCKNQASVMLLLLTDNVGVNVRICLCEVVNVVLMS